MIQLSHFRRRRRLVRWRRAPVTGVRRSGRQTVSFISTSPPPPPCPRAAAVDLIMFKFQSPLFHPSNPPSLPPRAPPPPPAPNFLLLITLSLYLSLSLSSLSLPLSLPPPPPPCSRAASVDLIMFKVQSPLFHPSNPPSLPPRPPPQPRTSSS